MLSFVTRIICHVLTYCSFSTLISVSLCSRAFTIYLYNSAPMAMALFCLILIISIMRVAIIADVRSLSVTGVATHILRNLIQSCLSPSFPYPSLCSVSQLRPHLHGDSQCYSHSGHLKRHLVATWHINYAFCASSSFAMPCSTILILVLLSSIMCKSHVAFVCICALAEYRRS